MYPFGYLHLFYPAPRYTWHKVRTLCETDKAILVIAPYCHARPVSFPRKRESMHGVNSIWNPNNDNIKIWIPKSQIRGIRLRNNVFEIYIREGLLG